MLVRTQAAAWASPMVLGDWRREYPLFAGTRWAEKPCRAAMLTSVPAIHPHSLPPSECAVGWPPRMIMEGMHMTESRRTSRRTIGVALVAGALVASAMPLVASVGPASAATTIIVQPGSLGITEKGDWSLYATGDGGLRDEQALANTSGWIMDSGRGGALLHHSPAPVVAALGTHAPDGLRLDQVTSMKVTLRNVTSGATGPRVTARFAGLGIPANCRAYFFLTTSSAWTTYDLYTAPGWQVRDCVGGAVVSDLDWAGVDAAVPPAARLNGGTWSASISVEVGDSVDVSSYSSALVDSFEFNGTNYDFQAPAMTVRGAGATVATGDTENLPVEVTLSGPNQPTVENDVDFLTASGGQVSSAVPVAKGPCTVTVKVPPPPSGETFATFAPKRLLPTRAITSAGIFQNAIARSQIAVLAVKGTGGGTCTISLGSATNAVTSGSVAVKVTPPPAPPTVIPPPVPTTCVAKAVSKKSKIKVDMGPDLPGNGYYKFRIDVKKKGEWFRYLKMKKTQGATETRTVNVPKGTYRAKCYGPTEAQDSRSKVVKIKK